MKRILQWTILAGAALSCAAGARAADIQIIASKDVTVTEISADDLKRIFLETKSSIGPAKVKPVMQQGGAAHEEFVKQVMGQSDEELKAYYKGLVFSGKGVEPKMLAGDAAVLSFVSMSKGAIAYVSKSAIIMGVNKIAVK